MTLQDLQNHKDPLDILGEEDLRELASRTLEGLLSPSRDWLEIHKQAHLDNPPPGSSEIESMLEDLTPSVETEEGTIHAELDAKQVRFISRELGDAFGEAEERLGILAHENSQDFLSALDRSVRWSVSNQLVDHPELEIGQWMETAESMGLSMQARDAFMFQGGPEELGRWWKYAPPLEEDWKKAFYILRCLVEQRKLDLACKWIDPLMHANLPEPGDLSTPRTGRPVNPPATTQYRSDALDSLWAQQVSLHYGAGGASLLKEGLRLIHRLEEEGAGDMRLIDWEALLCSEDQDNTLAPPNTVRKRLTQIAQNHPKAYANWIETKGESTDSQEKERDLKRITVSITNGKSHLDLFSVAQVLKNVSPDGLIKVMTAIDDIARKTRLGYGQSDGYGPQILACTMDMAWNENAPSAPRQRF